MGRGVHFSALRSYLLYGQKADVWAVGYILYQMCTLQPPFYSSNMLALAR